MKLRLLSLHTSAKRAQVLNISVISHQIFHCGREPSLARGPVSNFHMSLIIVFDNGAFCWTGFEKMRLAPSIRAAIRGSEHGDGNPSILWNAEIAADAVLSAAAVFCSARNARYRITVLGAAGIADSWLLAAQTSNQLNSPWYFFHVVGALEANLSLLAFAS